MYYGFDLGSRFVKLVTMSENKKLKFNKYDTMDFYKHYGHKENNSLLIDFSKLGFEQEGAIISTGYGRNTIKIHGGDEIPEIRAHVYGALWQTGLKDFTLLDLGGQDSKVILVKNGKIIDFQTNDKCAASSGRYLENMAGVIGIDLNQLSLYSDDPVDLSSTCAIFGESELIGKVLEGNSIESLAAGINYTIYKRVKPMLKQLASERIVFTGGVAQNKALHKIITNETGLSVTIPEYPQYNGAIGCCVHGGRLLD